MASGGTGRYFTVTLNGKEETYYINRDVLSERTIDRVRSLIKLRRRDARKELLHDVKEADLPAAFHQEVAKQLVQGLYDQVGLEDALDMIQSGDHDALAVLVMEGCDEIRTLEHARQIIEAHEDTLDLLSTIMEINKEDLEAAKNSDRPQETQVSE